VNCPCNDWLDVAGVSASVVAALGVLGGAFVYWRDWLARRSQQARLISAWIESIDDSEDRQAVIANRSEFPIFDVRVETLLIEAEPLAMEVLPPGKHHAIPVVEEAVSARHRLYGVDLLLQFTDAAGNRWERRRDSLSRLGSARRLSRRN
jgi:hypothetical protein